VDSAELLEEQPMPTPNDAPSVQSMVMADLQVRLQVGISRYGTGLQAFNGRDALRDLYEELLDAACYIRQAIAERDTAPKRCADCNRRSDDLAQCADEQWRGPTCRKRHEASAGVQLPIGDRS
jgi:hypothetical protein